LKKCLKYLFIIVVITLQSTIFLRAQSYNFKNYNTEQGLPQSQVLCAFQDHFGNMWFGTNSGGVGKFDGNKFTTISDNDGLIDNVVFSITENHKKELVFGTSKGISVYNGINFKNYDTKNGFSNSWIFSVLQDGDKTWIGTQEGVYILQSEKIRRFSFDKILDKAAVFTLFMDSKKQIWFGTINDGAICFNQKDNSFKHYTEANGLQKNFIFSFGENNKNEIYVGTQAGLNIIDNNFKVKNGTFFPRQENIAFRSMLVKPNSNIEWHGTSSDGTYKFENNTYIIYRLNNGLTYNSAMCIFSDRENNIWIGTDGSGVYKHTNDIITYYSKQNGLPENYVNAVVQDTKGVYWLALRNSGITKIDGQTITNYKFNQNNVDVIPDNEITTILASKDGKLFFGTRDGLCIYDGTNFKTVSKFDFRHKYILSLFQDSKNNIWIGTNNGIFKYTNGEITDVPQINSLRREGIDFPIFSISEDKNSNIWVGSESGAIKFDLKSISLFNETTNFVSKRISTIITDNKKNIWFGTEEGVFVYDYSKFQKISKKNGLSSNFINFLQLDNKNRMFIGLNTGVEILDLNDFYNKKITIKHLGKDDGLISIESNSNASYKDLQGRILMGTINGLEIYDPRLEKKNTLEPLTNITSVKLFFGQEDIFKYSEGIDSIKLLPKKTQLPFNKNHITFQFVGISLMSPEKVMYQYMLEGVDETWTPPTSKTEATYSSLQPGKYKFLLKAMNNDGVWNKEPVIFEFSISPPWYATWWFYTICIITLISGIILYNNYRTKKLIADKQKLEKIVDERTHELREEKEKVEVINKEVLEQKAVIEHKNTEITDSIKYAKNIQEALLPNLKEINSLFTNSFVLYMPKDIVSGDFYWFAKNGNTKFIAAVDCTGHGVPGAFMSIVGNTLLNEIVNEKKIIVPGEILLELHKGVKIALNQNAQEFERRDGMDIALCAFTEGSNTIQYSGANRPLWIYKKDNNFELESIKATKYPIGGLELEDNRQYENHTISLNEGDCIYLFSDGYADQFGGPKGKKFMLTNLQKTIFNNINQPMTIQKEKLSQSFMDWKQDAEQIDDVLVIGIKI
jgi:ligand-binding sensor domain-containing protein/serine phosphatase RsbU (regulator of sigma subunit)